MGLFGLLNSTKSATEIYDRLYGICTTPGGEGQPRRVHKMESEIDLLEFETTLNKQLGRPELKEALEVQNLFIHLCMFANGGIPKVIRILTALTGENKINLDLTNPYNDGGTALWWSCNRDSSEVSRILLYAGANPHIKNDKNSTPFHWALLCGDLPTLKILKEKKVDMGVIDDNNNSPLNYVMMTMLDEGFPDYSIDALKFIIEEGDAIYNEDLPSNELNGATMLMIIAQRANQSPNCLKLLKFLIKSDKFKTDVFAEDDDGNTIWDHVNSDQRYGINEEAKKFVMKVLQATKAGEEINYNDDDEDAMNSDSSDSDGYDELS